MASSPMRQLTAPGGARRRGGGPFLESSPRTVVGLAKVEVQLQKELGKLERQAQTAVSNIANHQQAMKMSWRRLEHQRQNESPLLSRAGRQSPLPSSPGKRRSILSSNTKLYVSSTPDAYQEGRSTSTPTLLSQEVHDEHSGKDGRSSTHITPPTSRTSLLQSSPYLSSPFPNRRGLHQLSTRATPISKHLHPSITSTTSMERVGSGQDHHPSAKQGRTHSESELKLPPIQSPSPQPSLVAHTNTVDKATLMKASTLLQLGSGSQGPDAFRVFYSADRPPSRALPLSPLHTRISSPTPGIDPEHSDERRELVRSSSEPSLAELFEQIKHCRYIRHYHPDGSVREEY